MATNQTLNQTADTHRPIDGQRRHRAAFLPSAGYGELDAGGDRRLDYETTDYGALAAKSEERRAKGGVKQGAAAEDHHSFSSGRAQPPEVFPPHPSRNRDPVEPLISRKSARLRPVVGPVQHATRAGEGGGNVLPHGIGQQVLPLDLIDDGRL